MDTRRFRYAIALFSLALALPAGAGFTTADFVISGDSRVGFAANVPSNPSPYTSQTATDVRSQNGPTGGGYLDPTAFGTSVQVGVLATDQRRAGTTGAALGTFNQGDTFTVSGSAFASVRNLPVTTSQYKGTGVSTVSFEGDFAPPATFPGVAISYAGDYFLQAFAQNNAPGGFNNNSAYSSVEAILTLANVTQGTTAGQVSFIDDMISQVFCGSTGACFPASLNQSVAGTVFLPITGIASGDVLRMTIDVVMSSDAYAKGFTDPSGGRQPAGGISIAEFSNLDITLLLIPEPASLALILVGVMSIHVARRRMRRNADA